MQDKRIVQATEDRAHGLVRQHRIQLAGSLNAFFRSFHVPCLLCRSQCCLGHLRSILVRRRQVAELQRTAAQLGTHGAATGRG
jgi:hypothetical protein